MIAAPVLAFQRFTVTIQAQRPAWAKRLTAKVNLLELLLVALLHFERLTNNALYGHSSNLASPQANPSEFDPMPSKLRRPFLWLRRLSPLRQYPLDFVCSRPRA